MRRQAATTRSQIARDVLQASTLLSVAQLRPRSVKVSSVRLLGYVTYQSRQVLALQYAAWECWNREYASCLLLLLNGVEVVGKKAGTMGKDIGCRSGRDSGTTTGNGNHQLCEDGGGGGVGRMEGARVRALVMSQRKNALRSKDMCGNLATCKPRSGMRQSAQNAHRSVSNP